MNEKPLNDIKGITFKGRFRGRRTNFMQKIVSIRETVSDAFESCYKTSISVYVPKLTPKYQKPHVIFHMVNGSSSCFFRVKDPQTLKETLESIITKMGNDRWLDQWWRVDDLSNDLIVNNKLTLDEELIDINAWKHSLEDTVDVDLVQIKKEVDGATS